MSYILRPLPHSKLKTYEPTSELQMAVFNTLELSKRLSENRRRQLSIRLAQTLLKEIVEMDLMKFFQAEIHRGIMSPEFKLLTFITSHRPDVIEDLLYLNDVSKQLVVGIRQMIILEPWVRNIPLNQVFDRSEYYVLDALEAMLGSGLYMKISEMLIEDDRGQERMSMTLSICLEPQHTLDESIHEIWPHLNEVSVVPGDNTIDWPSSMYPYWMLVFPTSSDTAKYLN